MTKNPNLNIKPGMLTLANPFPGLRPFSVEESHLYFGREGQCEIVLAYLAVNRFAAVTGASGSGKSSLIYCGLIPALYGGFITRAGSKWKIITTRPGNSPVENLAEAIALSEKGEKPQHELKINKQIIYTILRRSSFGLTNAVRQIKLAPGENILLILDQFEELFRYKESRKDITAVNETEAYIKLLVNAIKQNDQPIYVVLTMRSDFIGECSQFNELTRLINDSNYLIPQMTRDSFREAVTGPLAVGGAKIDPQLLQQVLNAIEDKSDQLPVLQHAMMRTWEFWITNNESGVPLRMRDYEAAGKIENALSMHADEAYEELSEEGKVICKVLFKCLTEKGTDNKGTRHPATVKHIAEIAQVTEDKVIEVANKFRAKGRSFLTPVEGIPIDGDTVIDISHESLMRIWDKLKAWVEEEFSSVQMYLRLAEAASLYQIGKTGLWRPPDLHLALNWRKTQKPTLAWAKKYNPAFEKVMVFLDASEKKYLQEEQTKVRLQRMELNRTRRFASTMLIAAIAFLFISVWGFQQRSDAMKQAKMAEMSRAEAEFRKQEADSLRFLAEGRMEMAEFQAMVMEMTADTAEQQRIIAQLESEIAERNRLAALQQAEDARRRSQQYQQEKEVAQQTAQVAKEQQTQAELDMALEMQKRMLSTAQTMASRVLQVNDNNLKGLLAYQAYLFNRDFKGQPDPPDIYNALYASLQGLNGSNYNALQGHEGGNVNKVAFRPGSNVCYSTGGDGKILQWDLDGNTRSYRTLIDNNFMNRTLAISPDGRWLANAATSSSIQLFNLNQSNPSPELLEGHKNWVGALCFTPDNRRLYSASQDHTIMYWDMVDKSGTVFVELPQTEVNCIALSPTGNYIFGGTEDGRLIRWNIETKEQTVLLSTNISIHSLAMNPTGSRIATGDRNGTLRILDARANTIILTISAHTAQISDLAFSPDGQQIATASTDKSLKIWDINNTSNQPVIISRHNAWVLSLAFSPDGRYIVSASAQPADRSISNIYYWPTHTVYMADQICGEIERNMTEREWETYVSTDLEYQITCPDK
ncbi:MAG: hypothetical protein JXB19_06870 [Bacteroidales bacterium]|nr:hypothetical protein [Bacteroidales bacterium]